MRGGLEGGKGVVDCCMGSRRLKKRTFLVILPLPRAWPLAAFAFYIEESISMFSSGAVVTVP